MRRGESFFCEKNIFFVLHQLCLSFVGVCFLAMPTSASVESVSDAREGEQVATAATSSGGERATAAATAGGEERGGGAAEGRTKVDGSLVAADVASMPPPPSSSRGLCGPPIVPPPLEGFLEASSPHREGETAGKDGAEAQNGDGSTTAGPPSPATTTTTASLSHHLPLLLAPTLSASVSSPHLRALARQLLLEERELEAAIGRDGNALSAWAKALASAAEAAAAALSPAALAEFLSLKAGAGNGFAAAPPADARDFVKIKVVAAVEGTAGDGGSGAPTPPQQPSSPSAALCSSLFLKQRRARLPECSPAPRDLCA